MKDLLSLPARTNEGVLVVVETPAETRPADVLALPQQLRSELEDFFVWSTRREQKDLRFLGWGGIDEAEEILAAAERAARG